MPEIVRQIGDNAVPLELFLKLNSEAITGATVVAAVRRISDNFFLDFNDNTFKPSGWTTKTQTLTEVTGVTELAGLYRAVWDSGSAITVIGNYAIEYRRTDVSPNWLRSEYVRFEKSHLHQRSQVNRLGIDQGTSELVWYAEDGTTEVARKALTNKDGLSIVLQGTGPVNRGA